ncbi:RrF2 family transcriptional regulator [Peribacillus muralis]|uniref:RrF2 family transcriptional regulator n=1 Tax=Peribacillus muralis TaxID=264697 RepID=UPI000708CB79|nr:Rrf2 family transcriptional regulator [Peribacillus muralis]MCK1992375.1 Rrf2 family transcriptional regulator [Peribacillus muralis]MCK2012931.1 Rrf2 family transcriptional regulator [Peribacillus muralis]
MQMKTGVEQSVYAILLLNFLPEKAVLSGDIISQQLGGSASYFQKILRKLVNADILVSVPGIKGGFKLKKDPEDIRIYDVYLAVEGKQSLYSSSGIFHDMLNLKEKEICLLSDLMEEAESSWKTILKRETIASLTEEINKKCPKENLQMLKKIVHEKMVL